MTLDTPLRARVCACLLAGLTLAALPARAAGPPAAQRQDAVGRRLLGLVNAYRAVQHRPRLRAERHLSNASRAYARAMYLGRFFAHTSPGGEGFVERVERSGYGGRVAGENLAWEEGYADPAAFALRAWIASPPHRAVLRNPVYTQGAVGVYCGQGFQHASAERCYLVLDTGAP
jgi:uncharacterized protein YkwD